MSKVRIELNDEGVQELLKNPAIVAECGAQATAIASACGDGYVTEPRTYRERHGYVVKPETKEAIKDNMDNNTLLKAARI